MECLEDDARLEGGGVGVVGLFFFFGERENDKSMGGGGFTEAARRRGFPHSSMTENKMTG
jgi:hypothetical protein